MTHSHSGLFPRVGIIIITITWKHILFLGYWLLGWRHWFMSRNCIIFFLLLWYGNTPRSTWFCYGSKVLSNRSFYYKSPTGARPVAMQQFASEVLGGGISMDSNEKSGSRLRGLKFTDAWHSLIAYTIRLTQTVALLRSRVRWHLLIGNYE